MSAKNTKEKILDVALELFSKRGYSAISIRNICKEVEIKESSVYYHFANKHAILNELQTRFEHKATSLMETLNAAIGQPFDISNPNWNNVSQHFFDDYLMDKECNLFLRLLIIEQGHNPDLRKVYDQWLFDEPLRLQSQIFDALMELKVIKPLPSEELAIKYYAPIFLYFQRYLISGSLTKQRKDLFRQKVENHLSDFLSTYLNS